MSALRFITRVAIAAAICGPALADPAHAKISGHAGQLVAFERSGDIWVRAPGLEINITNSPDAVDRAPSWGVPDNECPPDEAAGPPSQRNLVFESRPSGGHSDLMVAKLTGDPEPVLKGEIENLTNTPDADEGSPAAGRFSIAYTLGPVGSRDIWERPLAGGAARQLTTSSFDDRNPDLSGGGSLVYETADSAGTPQLAIIDNVAAPGLPRFVTAGPEQHTDPSWIDNRIVHVVTAYGVTYLDFLEQRAADPKPAFSAPLLYQLTGDPGGDLAPSWHPEASSVMFVSDRAQAGNLDIYDINADGTGLVRLTTDPAADRNPDFEPWMSGYCLQPEPYSPRPGTQARTDRRPAPTPPAPTGTPPAPTGTGKPAGSRPPRGATPLRIANLRVTKGGRGNRRFIVVRFIVNKPARGSLRALRDRRVVARRLNRPLAAGNATIRLNVPRTVRGGRHRLRLTVSSGATTLTFHRNVRIRALRQRR